jgi:hypothetical protein
MEIISRTICWVVINYVVISFVEHLIHGYLMHAKRFPSRIYTLFPYLAYVFDSHAVRHHRRWYKKFNHEPDTIGREENLAIGLVDTIAIISGTAPIWLAEMWVWLPGGLLYVFMMYGHNYLWNILHRQMHIPQNIVFKDWTVYKFLARYHFMHHQKIGQNLNIVFLGADFLMGTVAKPRLRDIREMLNLGLLFPQRKKVRRQSPYCHKHLGRLLHVMISKTFLYVQRVWLHAFFRRTIRRETTHV